MVKKLNIGEDLQHPGWSVNPPDAVLRPGLMNAHMATAENWVVQLEFYREGDRNYGTGFFINIPGASHDLILTAAHNLIGPSGNRSADLTVIHGGTRQTASEFRVSAAYAVKQTPEADYGAILLPRTTDRGSFSFSIKLAYEEHLKGDLNVIGYRSQGIQGSPETSSGICVACYAKQLEYKAKTQQGFSGSPVWMAYQGIPTVVAIHNHRPARNGAGSRGSRLTPALLREIFGWVSAGEYGVRLRAQGKTTMLPPRGLYLNFSEDFEFGRVRLGSGTIFDVLPAHVTPEKVLYALAVGTKWVMFNNARKEVVLTENMRDGCLFMKANVKIKKKTMQIVVEKEGKSYQLQMQGTRIREFDGEDAESSEVSMVEYPSKEQFVDFAFE
ncbi:hypothetical protein AcW1_003594 [Taiwanofungus camphoratus]|nr:hypothetical protein AcW1_003594 [Antrodia cinnamomea]